MPVFPHGADPPPACVASAPAPSTSSAAVPPSSAVAAGSSSRPAPIEFSDSDDDSNGLSIHSSDSDVVEFVSITMRPQQRRPQQPSTSAASSFNASRVPVASSLGSTVASSCRVGSGSGKMGGRKKKGSDDDHISLSSDSDDEPPPHPPVPKLPSRSQFQCPSLPLGSVTPLIKPATVSGSPAPARQTPVPETPSRSHLLVPRSSVKMVAPIMNDTPDRKATASSIRGLEGDESRFIASSSKKSSRLRPAPPLKPRNRSSGPFELLPTFSIHDPSHPSQHATQSRQASLPAADSEPSPSQHLPTASSCSTNPSASNTNKPNETKTITTDTTSQTITTQSQASAALPMAPTDPSQAGPPTIRRLASDPPAASSSLLQIQPRLKLAVNLATSPASRPVISNASASTQPAPLSTSTAATFSFPRPPPTTLYTPSLGLPVDVGGSKGKTAIWKLERDAAAREAQGLAAAVVASQKPAVGVSEGRGAMDVEGPARAEQYESARDEMDVDEEDVPASWGGPPIALLHPPHPLSSHPPVTASDLRRKRAPSTLSHVSSAERDELAPSESGSHLHPDNEDEDGLDELEQPSAPFDPKITVIDSNPTGLELPAETFDCTFQDSMNRRDPYMKQDRLGNQPNLAVFRAWMLEGEDNWRAPKITVETNDPVFHPHPPLEFAYVNRYLYGKNVPRPNPDPSPCGCTGVCQPDSRDCSCVFRQAKYNPPDEVHSAYDKRGKKLYYDAAIVECSDQCGCTDDCYNRVVQNGRKVKVEVFHTETKGWGVRSKQFIEDNTFVGIYSGQLICSEEANQRGMVYEHVDRTYLIDLDFYALKNLVHEETESKNAEGEIGVKYVVDAFHAGFTRFFNHSCNPNLRIEAVYFSDYDFEKPMFAFFATRDIPDGTELCWSYNGIDVADDEPTGALDKPPLAASAAPSARLRDGKSQKAKKGKGRARKMSKGLEQTLLTEQVCQCGEERCKKTMFKKGEDVGNGDEAWEEVFATKKEVKKRLEKYGRI